MEGLKHFVYIIQSIDYPNKKYVGHTNNIKKRLLEHNSGSKNSEFTKKYKPWKLLFYCAFNNNEKAVAFEKYLKSGSGRAFTNKRFI